MLHKIETMKKRYPIFILLILFLQPFFLTYAQSIDSTPSFDQAASVISQHKESSPKLDSTSKENDFIPSVIRFSGGVSTEGRSIFYVDYLLPLYYSEDQTTLLFINPKQSLYTPSAEETSLGAGLRKIFNDSFILGMHFFFDRRLAHSDC